MLMRCIVYKLMGPCGPMVKALVFTRSMRGAFLLLASVVTTRLSRLESWQGRQSKKRRGSIPNVRFVFPVHFLESQIGTSGFCARLLTNSEARWTGAQTGHPEV